MGSEVSEEPITSISQSTVVLSYVHRHDPTVCKTCIIKLRVHQTGSNCTVAEARRWVHITPILCIHFMSAYTFTSITSCLGSRAGGGGCLCCCVVFCHDISTLTAKQVVYYDKLEFDSLLQHRNISAASIPAVGPNPVSFTMYTGGSFNPRLYLPAHVTDPTHPASAEYENTACITT